MTDKRIRSILIAGGGTAGWMAAAGLAKALARMDIAIRLVESEQIGTVGVGETTIPPIVDFIRTLGIDENEVMREARATFKLGIAYRDWTRPGSAYFHPFGQIGSGIGPVAFRTYWLKMFLEGRAGRLEDYSIQAAAAAAGKFTRPVHAPGTPLNKIAYALHFDATLFARCLRRFAETHGVMRTEGRIQHVSLRPEDGFVRSVTLDSGETIEADLFLDCTGFRALLIEETLKTGFEDWTHLLPCDRALVLPTERTGPPPSHTAVTACEAGWQWRIPLQHCTGNGYVYCSGFTTEAEARTTLLARLKGRPLAQPVLLSFTTGRRKKAWNRNCIALGLSSGFLEPLESKSIHLIQRGIAMLLKFFPDRDFAPADIDRYNRILEFEFARARDFLLLHYIHTERRGAFWEHCRGIPPTDTLKEKLDLFRSHGRILREETELFTVQSWLSVMIGQNILPARHDPIADGLDPEKVLATLEALAAAVRRCAADMPPHQDYIDAHCSAAARPADVTRLHPRAGAVTLRA